MTLEDCVQEFTVYQVFCSECAFATDEQNCEEDAVQEAENIGFEIINDEVFCPKCAEDK